MFELVDNVAQSAVIKVVGVGGGGGNAVKHMIGGCVDGVEFICANTDAQALSDVSSRTVLQLGSGITKGLGAGANPEIGRQAALEDRDRIAEVLAGADMVFITAGMGGGTGTGAAPVIADIAKQLGILDDYVAAGFGFDAVEVFLPNGQCVAKIPTPRLVDGAAAEAVTRQRVLRVIESPRRRAAAALAGSSAPAPGRTSG